MTDQCLIITSPFCDLQELGKPNEKTIKRSRSWITRKNLELWFREDFPRSTVKFSDLKPVTSWLSLGPYLDYLLPCKHSIELGCSCYSFHKSSRLWKRKPAEEQRRIYLDYDPKFVSAT